MTIFGVTYIRIGGADCGTIRVTTQAEAFRRAATYFEQGDYHVTITLIREAETPAFMGRPRTD